MVLNIPKIKEKIEETQKEVEKKNKEAAKYNKKEGISAVIAEKIDLESLAQQIKTPWEVPTKVIIEPFARLTLELKDKLVHYDTILSDDTSGRLIALFFRDLINKQKKKADKEPVQTYFVAGGRLRGETIWRAIENFIEEKKNSLGKVLVVTEYIATGESLMPLVKILKNQGIDFDIASLSIDLPPNAIRYQDKKDLIDRLKFGSVGLGGAAFYHRPEFSGVTKCPPESRKGFSVEKDDASPYPFALAVQDINKMKTIREDMKLLANELSKLLE